MAQPALILDTSYLISYLESRLWAAHVSRWIDEHEPLVIVPSGVESEFHRVESCRRQSIPLHGKHISLEDILSGFSLYSLALDENLSHFLTASLSEYSQVRRKRISVVDKTVIQAAREYFIEHAKEKPKVMIASGDRDILQGVSSLYRDGIDIGLLSPFTHKPSRKDLNFSNLPVRMLAIDTLFEKLYFHSDSFKSLFISPGFSFGKALTIDLAIGLGHPSSCVAELSSIPLYTYGQYHSLFSADIPEAPVHQRYARLKELRPHYFTKHWAVYDRQFPFSLTLATNPRPMTSQSFLLALKINPHRSFADVVHHFDYSFVHQVQKSLVLSVTLNDIKEVDSMTYHRMKTLGEKLPA